MRSFCGCWTLKTGSFTAGAWNLIQAVGGLLYGILLLELGDEAAQHADESQVYVHYSDKLMTSGAIVITISCLLGVFGVVLIYGVEKKSRPMILSTLIYTVVILVAEVLFLGRNFDESFRSNQYMMSWMTLAIIFGVSCYFLVVVMNYYKNLKLEHTHTIFTTPNVPSTTYDNMYSKPPAYSTIDLPPSYQSVVSNMEQENVNNERRDQITPNPPNNA